MCQSSTSQSRGSQTPPSPVVFRKKCLFSRRQVHRRLQAGWSHEGQRQGPGRRDRATRGLAPVTGAAGPGHKALAPSGRVTLGGPHVTWPECAETGRRRHTAAGGGVGWLRSNSDAPVCAKRSPVRKVRFRRTGRRDQHPGSGHGWGGREPPRVQAWTWPGHRGTRRVPPR